MDKFGLIGNPIATSKSPTLFNVGYNGKYEYDLIEGGDFNDSWERFLKEYKGINVTAPFKEEAFQKADCYTSYCSKIGASNLAVKTPDGILADNSDFTGIICCIAEAYFPGLVPEFIHTFGQKAFIKIHQYFKQAVGQLFARSPQALIVGCGGAGRAAAVAAGELGFDTALMNRTKEKAQLIATELPEYNFIVSDMKDFKAALKECDLVIYTLPVKTDEIDNLDVADFEGDDRYEWSRPGKVILEANYKTPAFAGEVRKKMSASGCQYISGSRWLLYQAITGYSVLTGEDPDVSKMAEAATKF